MADPIPGIRNHEPNTQTLAQNVIHSSIRSNRTPEQEETGKTLSEYNVTNKTTGKDHESLLWLQKNPLEVCKDMDKDTLFDYLILRMNHIESLSKHQAHQWSTHSTLESTIAYIIEHSIPMLMNENTADWHHQGSVVYLTKIDFITQKMASITNHLEDLPMFTKNILQLARCILKNPTPGKSTWLENLIIVFKHIEGKKILSEAQPLFCHQAIKSLSAYESKNTWSRSDSSSTDDGSSDEDERYLFQNAFDNTSNDDNHHEEDEQYRFRLYKIQCMLIQHLVLWPLADDKVAAHAERFLKEYCPDEETRWTLVKDLMAHACNPHIRPILLNEIESTHYLKEKYQLDLFYAAFNELTSLSKKPEDQIHYGLLFLNTLSKYCAKNPGKLIHEDLRAKEIVSKILSEDRIDVTWSFFQNEDNSFELRQKLFLLAHKTWSPERQAEAKGLLRDIAFSLIKEGTMNTLEKFQEIYDLVMPDFEIDFAILRTFNPYKVMANDAFRQCYIYQGKEYDNDHDKFFKVLWKQAMFNAAKADTIPEDIIKKIKDNLYHREKPEPAGFEFAKFFMRIGHDPKKLSKEDLQKITGRLSGWLLQYDEAQYYGLAMETFLEHPDIEKEDFCLTEYPRSLDTLYYNNWEGWKKMQQHGNNGRDLIFKKAWIRTLKKAIADTKKHLNNLGTSDLKFGMDGKLKREIELFNQLLRPLLN